MKSFIFNEQIKIHFCCLWKKSDTSKLTISFTKICRVEGLPCDLVYSTTEMTASL